VFLIFLAAYRDRDYVEAATSSKLTIGTGNQDDAVALALASNMTATDLDVSEIAVTRHRCQTHVRSHTQFHLPV
jgi:FixJ family two-component response regulator